MTPHELAAWAERAGPDEQRAVLEELWRKVRKPIQSISDPNARTILEADHQFFAMLDCGAFESAAISLVPEAVTGWSINVDLSSEYPRQQVMLFLAGDGVIGRGDAQTPALAIAAAIARTMED